MEEMDHLPAHHSERSLKIDVLRGIAVIGMIIAHGLFFFHNKSNPYITALEGLFNTTVFTVFIFVFGQSLSKWLDVHAFDHPKTIWQYSLKRAGLIYLLYALVGIVAVITSRPEFSYLAGTLTLTSSPNFTEYMALFIILVLLTPLLRPLLRLSRQSMLLTFVIGALSYLLGITLYEMHLPLWLTPIKALFAGDETLLRFPVLFYFPVVLWGLWWQHDSDHNTQDKVHTAEHLWMIIACVSTTVASVLVAQTLNIPILNPNTRWPPSISFLTMGISISTIGLFLMPSFAWVGPPAKKILGYFGRDALDLWVNHLLILFIYRKFIRWETGSTAVIAIMVTTLVVVTVILSSTIVTNSIRFPLNIAFSGTTRFRKRYAALVSIALLVLLWATMVAPTSPYGNFMISPPLSAQSKLPINTDAKLTAGSLWYVRHHPTPQSLELTVTLDTATDTESIHPDSVRIAMNGVSTEFLGITASDGTLHFTKPVADIFPGVYTISATIDNGDSSLQTNTQTVTVSEPLLVAWTFDWEGWDIPDTALQEITDLTMAYPTLKFSHFVNPRTFLPGVLHPTRNARILAFLGERYAKGDEIAMHLHMQYDLVKSSGVATTSAHAWGLRGDEGYDVPTTSYSPQEFRRIVLFAQKVASESGLPTMNGYRAGGWFLSTNQLNELKSLGFTYDSSGRDRPGTGPFRAIPWNLPIGAQPYYPSQTDQNLGTADTSGILEIPNNGVSTYDQSSESLISRIDSVYQGGILTVPKVLVFVSHPQFSTREFPKIPEVLTRITAMSQGAGLGPAVFVTTADIARIWNTLNN